MAELGPPVGIKAWWRSLTREQQISVGVLSVCGIIALGLSASRLRESIRAPFMVPNAILQKSQQFFAQQDQASKTLELQKTKDTDRDGLSDYDELYLYHTSPYLADSDSDGMQDAVEIAQGTDPNCPSGKPCAQRIDIVAQSSTTSADFQDILNATKVPLAPTEVMLGSSSATVGAQDFLAKPPNPAQMTPSQIREYLLAHNLVRSDQLDAVSDADIVSIYKAAYEEALRAQSITQAQATSTP
jgi:hypothetical protein